MAIALQDLRRAGAGSRPSRSQARRSTSGSIAAYWPTAPDSFPTRIPARAPAPDASGRGRAQRPSRRASGRTSSCTPCVLPMHTVSRCSSARATTARNARPTPAIRIAPASCTVSASAVSRTSDDVSPKWNQRPSSPSVSATASTNAAHRGSSRVRAPPRARRSEDGQPHGYGLQRRPARRRWCSTRRAQPARRRASWRASPRPTRSVSWRDARSERSRRHSRGDGRRVRRART